MTSFVVVAAVGGAGGITPGPEPLAVRTVAATPATPTVTIDGEDYPNPLRLNDGGAVTTAAQWEGTRRAELLADFRQNVYGRPLPEPTEQTFDVASTDFPGVTRKIVTVGVTGPEGTGSLDVTLSSREPAPRRGARSS